MKKCKDCNYRLHYHAITQLLMDDDNERIHLFIPAYACPSCNAIFFYEDVASSATVAYHRGRNDEKKRQRNETNQP